MANKLKVENVQWPQEDASIPKGLQSRLQEIRVDLLESAEAFLEGGGIVLAGKTLEQATRPVQFENEKALLNFGDDHDDDILQKAILEELEEEEKLPAIPKPPAYREIKNLDKAMIPKARLYGEHLRELQQLYVDAQVPYHAADDDDLETANTIDKRVAIVDRAIAAAARGVFPNAFKQGDPSSRVENIAARLRRISNQTLEN